MLDVTPLPIFTDNYVWMLHQPKGNGVFIVDPGDPSPIIQAIERLDLSLSGLLITHSHLDHIGGIQQMLDYKKVPVYGPDCAAIPWVDKPLTDGEKITLWDHEVCIISLPGHLPEHIAYVVCKNGSPTQIFSADIIFSAGCGRIFNGSHEELKYSLDKIKSFPADTLIYPAHEYTLANLRFATQVEPQNSHIQHKIQIVSKLRQENMPSLPVKLVDELDINPFIRCDQQGVIETVRKRLGREPADENEVFKTLRLWKDDF